MFLKNCLSEKYPDVVADFYISRRSKFIHLGLDIPLSKTNLSGEITFFIESQ